MGVVVDIEVVLVPERVGLSTNIIMRVRFGLLLLLEVCC